MKKLKIFYFSGATGTCNTKDTQFNKFCSQMLQPDGVTMFMSVPVCGTGFVLLIFKGFDSL